VEEIAEAVLPIFHIVSNPSTQSIECRLVMTNLKVNVIIFTVLKTLPTLKKYSEVQKDLFSANEL